MAKGKYKYHYFYKITNNINNHFYYGIHSTNNIDDGYMGSGSRLHHAYKKYGIENFTKEILKYFDTREELAQYEADVVTEELVLDENCYNISCGGEKWCTINSIPIIDKDGNQFRCKANDPKWLNGEYKTVMSGKAVVMDKNGKYIVVSTDYKKENNLHGFYHNKTLIIDENGNKKIVNTNDPKFISGEYKSYYKNHILVKDKNGKVYNISKDDERYKSGELIPMWCGRHHKQETKDKLSKSCVEKKLGENNPMYGMVWITNNETNKSIRVKKDELDQYLNNGWRKGRKM